MQSGLYQSAQAPGLSTAHGFNLLSQVSGAVLFLQNAEIYICIHEDTAIFISRVRKDCRNVQFFLIAQLLLNSVGLILWYTHSS